MSYITDLISNVGITSSPDNRYIAILDQDYNKILPEAQILDARVKPNKQSMDHTVEDGSTITDYVIVRPLEIDIVVLINSRNYQDVYFQIMQLYDKSTLLQIQTKTAVYDNQFIQDMPHTETAEMYDAIAMILRFKQAQIVAAKFNVAPKSASNTSTVNRGQQQGVEANVQQTNDASDSFANSYQSDVFK